MSNIGGITHQRFNVRPNVRVLQCNVRVLDAAPCDVSCVPPSPAWTPDGSITPGGGILVTAPEIILLLGTPAKDAQ